MKTLAKIEKNQLEKQTPLDVSIETWAISTTRRNLKRAGDITRDKLRAVSSFFEYFNLSPEEVSVKDVRDWHQVLLDRNYSESYIYATLAHLSSYFEWLKKSELGAFIKINPVRPALPTPPKKYNSSKAKSLTDEEFSKLWHYIEKQSKDDKNLVAVRDYAIFRFFAATGMRREEVLGIGAGDIKIESDQILIHTRIKGGDYDWRTITDGEVKAALERYLRLTKRKSFIGQKNKALWIRLDRAAKMEAYKRQEKAAAEGRELIQEMRLSSHSFDKQMKIYAHELGIGHFNIHKLRHTFARIVADEFGIIETQDALGHADLQTTRIYVEKIRFKKDKYSQIVRDRLRPPTNIEGEEDEDEN